LSAVRRYYRTARHLRLVQIANRLWRRMHRPPADPRPPPSLRAAPSAWSAPIAHAPTLVGPTTIRLLNREASCARAEDWRPQDAAPLWRYHLHYFDDLAAADWPARVPWQRALLERWVAENPPGRDVAWDAYPTSRRIVNWVKWALAGNALSPACLASLATQVRWLARRLEFHLLGNHLLANAKALAFGGRFFAGSEAEAWERRAERLLATELAEQVLPDGGHFERSPMYHATVLEDLLDLVNLRRAYGAPVPSTWLEAVARMRAWLAALSHPDGEIAFFNDAAFGHAATLAELDDYATRLGLPAVPHDSVKLLWLADSGYVRSALGAAVLLCDCAPVGPDYLPGHAHADTLSFELSLGGQRIVVNSGTSEYGRGPERERQRGTAAHSTVVVDGADSSEVWGGFRVAARARVLEADAALVEGGTRVRAAHDGYRRLRGRNVHRRTWTLGERSLIVEDEVSGARRSAEAWMHFHPAVAVRRAGPGGVELEWPGGRADLDIDGADSIDVRAGTWHPRFGVTVANTAIVAAFRGAVLRTTLRWSLS
jgi:uncharacterized heparinase superfamily protein